MKEVLYEVRCLKSNEDMILALAGQFKQLSHEPEKHRTSYNTCLNFPVSARIISSLELGEKFNLYCLFLNIFRIQSRCFLRF